MILNILCKIWKRIYNFKNKKDFEVTDKPNFTNACIAISPEENYQLQFGPFTCIYGRTNQIIYAIYVIKLHKA